jgi:hypothetical protein
VTEIPPHSRAEAASACACVSWQRRRCQGLLLIMRCAVVRAGASHAQAYEITHTASIPGAQPLALSGAAALPER